MYSMCTADETCRKQWDWQMRIGVVGAGSAGTRHINNVLQLGHDVLVYDVDTACSKHVCEQSKGRALYSDSMESFIAQSTYGGGKDIDALVIATPLNTHASWLRKSVELWLGALPVFVEKPVADYETLHLVPSVSKFDAPVLVGYNWLWHDSIKALRKSFNDPRRISVRLRTNMQTWPGNSYGPPLLECSHELAVLWDWIGPLIVTGRSSDSIEGTAGTSSCPVTWRFMFEVDCEHDKLHGREWIVTNRDECHGSYFIPASGQNLKKSYVNMMKHFMKLVDNWNAHSLNRQSNSLQNSLDIARLCSTDISA